MTTKVKSLMTQKQLNSRVRLITKRYYEQLTAAEQRFDKEIVKVSQSLLQSLPVGSVPCEKQFLEEISLLKTRYLGEMRVLSNICDSLGLNPSKIRQAYSPAL